MFKNIFPIFLLFFFSNEAIAKQIEIMTKDEINALSGKAMLFKMGDFELPFTAEDFVQSFSLPNFYFHVTTAYDILRMKGAPLGKLDFLGKIRTS